MIASVQPSRPVSASGTVLGHGRSDSGADQGAPAARLTVLDRRCYIAEAMPLPGFIAPCQPTKAKHPPSGGAWLHEKARRLQGHRLEGRRAGAALQPPRQRSDLLLPADCGRGGRAVDFDPSVIENHGERCATAVRENVRPTLAIVLYESPNGHRLHCARDNSGRRVIDPDGDTKQNDAVLCAELRRLGPASPCASGGTFSHWAHGSLSSSCRETWPWPSRHRVTLFELGTPRRHLVGASAMNLEQCGNRLLRASPMRGRRESCRERDRHLRRQRAGFPFGGQEITFSPSG